MLVERGNKNLPWCCAVCGWEGIPAYRNGKPSTHCLVCERPETDEEMLALGLPRVRLPKVGRNEPCPCGSGQKFKRCCG